MCYLNENTIECAKECQVPISLRIIVSWKKFLPVFLFKCFERAKKKKKKSMAIHTHSHEVSEYIQPNFKEYL